MAAADGRILAAAERRLEARAQVIYIYIIYILLYINTYI